MGTQNTAHATVIVAGIPEHLNQYFDEVKQEQSLYDALSDLKASHIISSQRGEVASTAVSIDNEVRHLITVGLGNINQMEEKDYLKKL